MLRMALTFCLLVSVGGFCQANETSVAQSLQMRVRAFHADAPKEDLKLRVIYFYPADRQPQANYRARVNRMVLDIKEFYDTEFARIGLTNSPLPVEMDGDEVKIHLVKGAENHDGYGYDGSYGRKILREIGHQLRGTVDPDREFLLILCALCDKQEDGRYKIYSPYYGLGGANHVRGICFAADCEMLDTLNLTKTDELFRYNEHNRDQQRTLADFNTVFIGGMAHELGHGLSLPHNRELPSEKSKGTALMGSGNYTYRAELVGKKGSFMTLASATRMMCHPLLTQSNKQRFERTNLEVTDIEVSGSGKALTVRGKVKSNVEPFAVIAYSDAEGGSNYDAYQWTSEVAPDGTFEVTLDVHKPGNNALRLSFCHANGATNDVSYAFTANKQGEPDVPALKDERAIASLNQEMLSGNVQQAREFARQYLAANPQSRLTPMLEYMETFDATTKPVPLNQVTQNDVFLSDVEAASSKVGYGRPTRNSYLPLKSRQDGGFFLRPGGQFHAKGFYAHAPSRFTFNLDGQWKRFTAVAGMQSGAWQTASAIFIVKGDGQELFRSGKLRTTSIENVDVDVTGIKQLELITESGENNVSGCWSVWGSPKVSR
ncbi:NPCBM/NEW2 domain protein [Bremerella volcania]|uniref:NPCBM/NEW2 domain protein n=1 Tax=Bremerella volcania TaxID=2527984 RepID=A0A518C6R0_9BACT|nr:NPCBM/NEW2 domain-containing protein [Bremerella volcania]QDU74907.1 NPCBM/NEW2 domain protein [Bremerella volcania]